MKETIRCRSIVDGKLVREWETKRAVYRTKGGRIYIRDWRGRVDLKPDPDGMLATEYGSVTNLRQQTLTKAIDHIKSKGLDGLSNEKLEQAVQIIKQLIIKQLRRG